MRYSICKIRKVGVMMNFLIRIILLESMNRRFEQCVVECIG